MIPFNVNLVRMAHRQELYQLLGQSIRREIQRVL
jgi:hypothetical protein